jgi:hypothetical protein
MAVFVRIFAPQKQKKLSFPWKNPYNIASALEVKNRMLVTKKEKQRWAEEHALRMIRGFEQWQKQLGISGDEYRKHLKEELIDCCDNPLLKSLIESIC